MYAFSFFVLLAVFVRRSFVPLIRLNGNYKKIVVATITVFSHIDSLKNKSIEKMFKTIDKIINVDVFIIVYAFTLFHLFRSFFEFEFLFVKFEFLFSVIFAIFLFFFGRNLKIYC